MTTALIIFYSFMAGMTAEWSHTRQKELGFKKNILIKSLAAAILWPVVIWRSA